LQIYLNGLYTAKENMSFVGFAPSQVADATPRRVFNSTFLLLVVKPLVSADPRPHFSRACATCRTSAWICAPACVMLRWPAWLLLLAWQLQICGDAGRSPMTVS
jgi:hypothetical protein